MSGLTFHPYGFIVGIAIVIALQLMEYGIKRLHIFSPEFLNKRFYTLLFIAFLFGIVGARAWHVITDFHLYINSFIDVFKIWNGGLSILGAVVGAVGGAFVYVKRTGTKSDLLDLWKLLDSVIFGLPVGQVVGRIANYINVELYGAPYDGLFKLFIPFERRLPGFESVAYYHPLFAYEMVFTGLFAMVLHYLIITQPARIKKLIGTTRLFQYYVLYYAIARFFLDFLRIERGSVLFWGLGFNQIFLLAVVAFLVQNLRKND